MRSPTQSFEALEELESGALGMVHGGQSAGTPQPQPWELRQSLGNRQPTDAQASAYILSAQRCMIQQNCPDRDRSMPMGTNYMYLYAAANRPGHVLDAASRARLDAASGGL
jgi:hypothetical protein